MSVEAKVLNLVNYITGSAGGWPSLSRGCSPQSFGLPCRRLHRRRPE